MFYTFDLLPFPGQPLFVLRVFVWLCRTKKDECRRGGSSTRDVRLNCINYGVWGLVGSSSLAAVDWDLLHYLTTLKHELIFPYLHQISVHYFRSMRRHECQVCVVFFWQVSKREYDDCNLYEENNPKVVLNCSVPLERRLRHTIDILEFSPFPGATLFDRGESYYYISTCDVTEDPLWQDRSFMVC